MRYISYTLASCVAVAAMGVGLMAVPSSVSAQSYSGPSLQGAPSKSSRNVVPVVTPPPTPEPVTESSTNADDALAEDTNRVVLQLLGISSTPDPEPEDTGSVDLKALSEAVAQSIQGFEGKDEEATTLQARLETLVTAARAQGKSDSYVSSLIDEATRANIEQVPAALKSETGAVDTSTLLQGIVGEAAVSKGDSYITSLQSELGEQEAPAKEGTTIAGVRYITVRPGETLSRISARVYGNALLYDRIYQANTDVMRNPNVVDVGMRLRIP
ncbi:MAG: LysM peptidoglycan-binding domain-containing protein [Pikeienuella sp.]